MKQKFSAHWKGSKQTRKQRKYRANAPITLKRKMLSAHLDKELRKKYGKRSFPIRKGDLVKITFGKNKGKKGKVSVVNIRKFRVAIEGIQISRKDGTKVNLWFEPSNLLIQELELNDKKRMKALVRKASEVKKTKKEEKENAQNKTKHK
jgi:large subunit ribosomal protein L24